LVLVNSRELVDQILSFVALRPLHITLANVARLLDSFSHFLSLGEHLASPEVRSRLEVVAI
jgi:hypothetical protein